MTLRENEIRDLLNQYTVEFHKNGGTSEHKIENNIKGYRGYSNEQKQSIEGYLDEQNQLIREKKDNAFQFILSRGQQAFPDYSPTNNQTRRGLDLTSHHARKLHLWMRSIRLGYNVPLVEPKDHQGVTGVANNATRDQRGLNLNNFNRLLSHGMTDFYHHSAAADIRQFFRNELKAYVWLTCYENSLNVSYKRQAAGDNRRKANFSKSRRTMNAPGPGPHNAQAGHSVNHHLSCHGYDFHVKRLFNQAVGAINQKYAGGMSKQSIFLCPSILAHLIQVIHNTCRAGGNLENMLCNINIGLSMSRGVNGEIQLCDNVRASHYDTRGTETLAYQCFPEPTANNPQPTNIPTQNDIINELTDPWFYKTNHDRQNARDTMQRNAEISSVPLQRLGTILTKPLYKRRRRMTDKERYEHRIYMNAKRKFRRPWQNINVLQEN